MLNIHATLVCLNDKGILLLGKSGAGKSDLALRLIMEHKAKLVADDRVNIENINGEIIGHSPDNIAGMLEIRGLGIANFPYISKAKIDLCVELCADTKQIERLPLPETIDFLGVSLTKIKLNPFESSTICKIVAKISGIIS